MDKLDKINYENNMKKHLVKWWDVNYSPFASNNTSTDTLSPEEEITPIEVLGDNEQMLAMRILKENSNQKAFEKASTFVENEERNRSMEAEQEANAIYERLMREAAEDEAKKQAEIEAAKMMAIN